MSRRAAAAAKRGRAMWLLPMVKTTAQSRLHVARRPSGEVAAERLYELMCEMGEDYNQCQLGWIAEVARKLDIPYGLAWAVVDKGRRNELRQVRPDSVDYAIRATGIPPQAFYDSEFKG